jgi:hypothetical protein
MTTLTIAMTMSAIQQSHLLQQRHHHRQGAALHVRHVMAIQRKIVNSNQR